MARLGRGLGGGSVGGSRHAAALLAAARDRGHRGLRLAVAGRADAAQRLLARAGLGHGPFRRRLLLDPRSLLCPAGRLRPARPADRRRPRGRAGILPGPRRLGVAPHHRSLARSRRPLQPPGCAGDRLDGCRVAARAPLHRLSVESAGACLGLCHAFATGRGAVRSLWPWHVDLPRARSADGRLAGIDRGTPGRSASRAGPASRRWPPSTAGQGSGPWIRIVQPNVPQSQKWRPETRTQQLTKLVRDEPPAGLRPPVRRGLARDGAAARSSSPDRRRSRSWPRPCRRAACC